MPKPQHADEIKKRTLTNLYNAMPTWLANVHRNLDAHWLLGLNPQRALAKKGADWG